LKIGSITHLVEHAEGMLSRMTRGVRRDKPAFPELEALRRGLAPRRVRLLDRLFARRQFLVRGSGKTVVVDLGPRPQIAAAALCLLAVAGLVVGAASVARDHRATQRMARELEELRDVAQREAEHARRDHELAQRLGEELAQRSAERDEASAAAYVDGATVIEQQSDIGRLTAERDKARAQRDKALAERDAAWTDNIDILLQLDAKTQNTIAQVESIIASTGLDPARVVKVPTRTERNAPRGGPFIPWTGQATAAGSVEGLRVNGVAPGLERLQALRDMLAHLPIASPLAQIVVSNGFGYRADPFSGQAAMHEGVDLRGPYGAGVFATAAGVVTFAGWHGEYGNMVEIDHGFGLVTRYAHLSKIDVKTGDHVSLHGQLGRIGATGRATGVHLHYEVRVDGHARNPVSFLKTDRYVPEADRHVPEEIPAIASQSVVIDRH